MKKILAIILSLLLMVSLTACGDKPDSTEPPDENSDGTDPVIPPESGDIVLGDSSYWVLETSEGDVREYVPEGENLLTDLTLWPDGTARIREIEDGMWLVSDGDEQNMTWTFTADGTLCLYTQYSFPEPFWTGTLKDGNTLELERFGGTYTFRREAMPEGGALYSPAELQGIWLIASSEIEGEELEALPGDFNTLVFQTGWGGKEAEQRTLLASSEYGGGGYMVREDDFSAYQEREITVLDDILYEGCGNEVWSVRIGEESPLNEHGLPENTETYVTLLDQNTLLQQKYFSFDNGTIPGVSYQTFKRYLPKPSWDVEKADLMGGDFELAGYIDADGIRHTEHPEYNGFYLHLDTQSYSFRITADDGFDYMGGGGYWEMGTGGTLQMTSEGNDEDWLAGAVQSFNEIPEIYLRDSSGGILWLTHVEGSGGENYGGDGPDDEWDGYVDTMSDLEGRAFSAPENTLFVLYNQDYADLSKLNAFRTYEIDDGPDAQYLLVTSTVDGNYFWLEENGYCREDFGTVDAGDSFIFKVNLSESGRYLLQIESPLGDYFIVLTKNLLPEGETWNYFTT